MVELRQGDRFLSYYDNNEGRRVYVTEVIADNVRFLESSNSGGGNREEGMSGSHDQGYNQQRSAVPRDKNQDPFQDDGKPIDISDDDLPF